MARQPAPSGADDRLEAIVRSLLEAIGEDPAREGLRATPARVAETWRHFTRGYTQSAEAVLEGGVFEEVHEGIVVVRDIDFYSICEHHLVPFFGKCHVAYLPGPRIAGLSKIARLVDMHARRLQVQERLTRDIALAIEKHLQPKGVAVRVEAQHLCMMMRGVEQKNAVVITATMRGVFRTDPAAAAELRSAFDARE